MSLHNPKIVTNRWITFSEDVVWAGELST